MTNEDIESYLHGIREATNERIQRAFEQVYLSDNHILTFFLQNPFAETAERSKCYPRKVFMSVFCFSLPLAYDITLWYIN